MIKNLFFKFFSNNSVKNRRKKTIKFCLNAPAAKNVSLTGDFNAWNPQGIRMQKNRNGTWCAGIKLCAGRYEYKFIVDDQWWIDPENEITVQNAYGAINSIKKVVF